MLNNMTGSMLPTDSGHGQFVDAEMSPVRFLMLIGELISLKQMQQLE